MLLVMIDYAFVTFLVWAVLRSDDAVLQRVVLVAVAVQVVRLSIGANIGQVPGAVFDFVAVVGAVGGDPSNVGAVCHYNTTGHAALMANLAGTGSQFSTYFYRMPFFFFFFSFFLGVCECVLAWWWCMGKELSAKRKRPCLFLVSCIFVCVLPPTTCLLLRQDQC